MKQPRKISSLMKTITTVFTFCAVSLSSLAPAKALRAEGPFNPNLLIFTAELEEFVSQANELKEKGGSLAEQEEGVKELMLTANRIAIVYYDESTDAIRASLDKHLGSTITDHPALDSYFTILGNSFVQLADRIVSEREARDHKIRVWSTIAGTVAGVAVGGYLLHVRLPNGLSSITGKDALYVASAVIGLGALGYGAGHVVTYVLPVDRRLENARDFVKRYPFGQDFLKHLKEGSDDLNLDALFEGQSDSEG